MQNVFIYPGALFELKEIINKLGCSRIFLVSGKKSFELSGAHKIIEKLTSGLQVIRFSDFHTNPDWEDVKNGITVFNESHSDVILSVGGGSVIDMAKLINYYSTKKEGISEADYLNRSFYPVTHICIPTTAGSGSEATHFAVMYFGTEKYSIAHNNLKPQYVMIDPDLHYDQTPYQKAVSGIDAFSQAIESFWSVNSTEESRIYALRAMNLIWNYLAMAVNNADKTAHLQVAVGAYLAGKAINISKTTAPHALSYSFTKRLGIPHGHAVALSLPFFINVHINAMNHECNAKCNVEHLLASMQVMSDCLGVDMEVFDLSVREFIDNIGITLNLCELNVSEEQFFEIVKATNTERLNNNPTKVDSNTYSQLYKYLNTNRA